ncbi:MAG: FAD:protein FMN transferase [Proteobacteria bacterium]|nr:FAD:protein FMN transferase [Pseudomonadota bacterium]MBU1740361.1 FAD:protein FMN transferase [Pseudomonadota bacterium]
MNGVVRKSEKTADGPSFDRRRFLRVAGLVGLGLAGGGLAPGAATAIRFDQSRFRVKETRPALGTFVTLLAVDPSRDRAQEALGLAWQEIDRLTKILSRYDPSTPVSVLNRDRRLNAAPPELLAVLDLAARLHRRSGGALDVTVAPVVDLFRRSAEAGGRWPTAANIADALSLVDAGRLRVRGGAVGLLRPGMAVTLDGVAKGFIVDRASDLLRSRGVGDHLIDAGGDIRVSGRKAPDRPWRVAVRDPLRQRPYGAVINLTNAAVATSGGYEIFFDCQKIHHHLIDPNTGRSPQTLASLSVIAPTAALADALATAGFIMGLGPGRGLIEALPGGASLAVTRRGDWIRSDGWPSRGG